MKEQLVEMTGLSPRVIRVWFQNKRCKHNKKTNALKMQMEQEKVSRATWSRALRAAFTKSSFIRTRR
jgi:Homeodomain